MQFTKLFSSILDSTIWQEGKETRLVWVTMLAMCDRSGEVHASIPGLAVRAGVSIAECENALACLMSPDPYSRTKDHEGRRIKEIDQGWELLNHAKYRALLSTEERREYLRRKQQEHRAKVSTTVNTVNKCQSASMPSTHAEAEAEAEADLTSPGGDGSVLNRRKSSVPSRGEVEEYVREHAPEICAQEFYDFYESKSWMVGKNKMKQWKSAVATWRHRATKTRKKPRLPDYNTPEGMAELESAFLSGDAT